MSVLLSRPQLIKRARFRRSSYERRKVQFSIYSGRQMDRFCNQNHHSNCNFLNFTKSRCSSLKIGNHRRVIFVSQISQNELGVDDYSTVVSMAIVVGLPSSSIERLIVMLLRMQQLSLILISSISYMVTVVIKSAHIFTLPVFGHTTPASSLCPQFSTPHPM